MKRLKSAIKFIAGLILGLIDLWVVMGISFILFAIVTLPIWGSIWLLWQL